MDSGRIKQLRIAASVAGNVKPDDSKTVMRRTLVKLAKQLNEALDEIEDNKRKAATRSMDSLDAMSYSIHNNASKSQKVESHLQDPTLVQINVQHLKTLNNMYKNKFGTFKAGRIEFNVWDLTKDWLKTDNDTFFKVYGFNYVPPIEAQTIAKEIIWSEDKWLKAERELANGTLEMRMKSCENLDSNLLKGVDLGGLTKKMGKTTFSLLS